MTEPYLSRQWFVKMAPLAAPAIEAARKGKVKFFPSRWKKVYLNWLEGIRDWCISRQLWWGHRIPVWTCTGCNETIVEVEAPARCPKCGNAELKHDEDVLDTWFSSWLWPFSTLGWPEKTPNLERFYLGRHFANKLWNAFRLVTPYLREYTPDETAARPFLTDADQWILSKLNTTVRQVTRNLRAYRIGDAAKDIYDFTWRELCDWYLEMAKPRLYAGPDAPGAQAVRFTIHRVFETVLRLLHPFMPFLSEELWHALPATDGDVCVAEWPAPARTANKDAEAKVELLKEIVG